jgi:non-ribosomal peptide synthetase component F
VETAQVRTLPVRRVTELSEATTEGLAGVARTYGVTLNTVVGVAWALTLHRLTGNTDIVFGSTVSGRSPELPGYQDIVGLLINTLPVRVRIDPEDKLGELLSEVQGTQAELSEYHHLSLGEIRRAAGAGELFDTCVVFENYATVDAPRKAAATLRITGMHGQDPYHYPLKLTVSPEQRLHLAISHRPDLVPSVIARQASAVFVELLQAIAARPADVVGTFLPAAAEVDRVQDILAGHAAELLGVAKIGLDDDLFALGADSLVAMRLTGRIAAELNSTVDIRTIFQQRTVRRIANRCLLTESPDEVFQQSQ